MNKTYNIYCDESTHIENDKQPYMILSYISTPYHLLKIHNKNIRKLKIEHFYRGEMKWSSLSKSQFAFYEAIIKYFFENDLKFRAIVINKSKLDHKAYNQSHSEFYDKMYYQLLYKKIDPENNYNIYIDIKDTYSYLKARSLKTYLEKKHNKIRTLQIIRSYESELMQLTDVLMGAINYKLRGLDKVIAKNDLIYQIENRYGKSITVQTKPEEEKFNLFFIDL